MDLKSELRRRIALLWANKATSSLSEKNPVMKILYKKMRVFIRFFLFSLIENHLFSWGQITILF